MTMFKTIAAGDTVWLYFKAKGTYSQARAEKMQQEHPRAVVVKKGTKNIYCRLENSSVTEKFVYNEYYCDDYGDCLVNTDSAHYFSDSIIAFKSEKEMKDVIKRITLISSLKWWIGNSKEFHLSDYSIEDVEAACRLLGVPGTAQKQEKT